MTTAFMKVRMPIAKLEEPEIEPQAESWNFLGVA
jgi:hypothetical protein